MGICGRGIRYRRLHVDDGAGHVDHADYIGILTEPVHERQWVQRTPREEVCHSRCEITFRIPKPRSRSYFPDDLFGR
jgi:hypothetical protein